MDNSYVNENDNENESEINHLKMISVSTKDILNDLEINQKNSNINNNNIYLDKENIDSDILLNKYIEDMKKLEKICLSKEKKREKLNISFCLIKNNINFIYNEINKDKEIQMSFLYKKRKKKIKRVKK